MKKGLILYLCLFVICVNTNIVFASKDSEIRSYRAVKQAKSKVISELSTRSLFTLTFRVKDSTCCGKNMHLNQ